MTRKKRTRQQEFEEQTIELEDLPKCTVCKDTGYAFDGSYCRCVQGTARKDEDDSTYLHDLRMERGMRQGPELQNIPIRTPDGRRIRDVLVGLPGQLLRGMDYSEIELRVIGKYEKEKLKKMKVTLTFEVPMDLDWEEHIRKVLESALPKVATQATRPEVVCTHPEDADILRDTYGNPIGAVVVEID